MRPVSALALAGAAVAGGALLEPHFPVLRRYTVPALPDDAEPMTVLHLSDLHLLPRHGRRSRWIQGLGSLQADLIVVTGDLWSSARSMPLLGATLGTLTA